MSISKWLRKESVPKAPNIPKASGDQMLFDLGKLLYEKNEEIRELQATIRYLRAASQAAEPRED